MTCILCDAPQTTGEIIFEDRRSMVLVHADWSTRGHLMVVWKTHVQNLSDLSAEEMAHIARVHHAAERATLEATGSERAIVLKLGIAVPHLHIHIYPVPSSLDRSDVMRIIDAKVRDVPDDGVRRALVERLRKQLVELLA